MVYCATLTYSSGDHMAAGHASRYKIGLWICGPNQTGTGTLTNKHRERAG